MNETGSMAAKELSEYFHSEVAYHEENYPEAMKVIYAYAGPLPEVPSSITLERVESVLDQVRRICAKIGR